jgi:uncharacterized lipoprotein YmbA
LPLKAALGTLACAGLLMLAGCASAPADHFYTLSDAGAAPAQATQPSQSAPDFLIQVAPVNVPQQVSRPQLVISTGPDRVDIKEQERWSAPLANEIGDALSSDLSTRLHTLDVYRTPHPSGLPVYRITLNVRRFESSLGTQARIDAVWSVHRVPGNALLTCRSTVSEAVGPGYGALVNGHRRALARVADDITAAVQALAAAPVPATSRNPRAGTARTASAMGAMGAASATSTEDTALAPQAACPAGS